MPFTPPYLHLPSVAGYKQLLLGSHFRKVLWEYGAGSGRQKHQTSPLVCSETYQHGIPVSQERTPAVDWIKKKQVGEESSIHLGSCADQHYRGLCTCMRGERGSRPPELSWRKRQGAQASRRHRRGSAGLLLWHNGWLELSVCGNVMYALKKKKRL